MTAAIACDRCPARPSRRRPALDATELLPIIAVLLVVTVEFGGHALLQFITTRRGTLTPLREQFFRAGHAHAGVLLILSLVYFLYLPRAEFSSGVEWLFGILLLVGALAQSGGFFLHLAIGTEGRSSPGTHLTRTGGVLIAAALIALAVGLIQNL
ncbi:hypothetical protein [Streptomyces qinzhouensis]|uniref:Uncharacterized protein n=1 Tax=Streptomyces qinzhouensis TaxID=2599401 RepID=A0A5B8IC88_9ACTN|nr:hypothetical protein [Streptomyces qinzhouensis]QDY75818.1 hypothetical protein FQU76_03980 [Streptomyces qinzhouensis]